MYIGFTTFLIMGINRQPEVDPGDNTKYLYHNLEVANLPPINTNDAEQVSHRFSEYFDICAKNDMKPSIAGLALSLGVSRQAMFDFENGRIHKSKEVVDAIKRAKSLINGMMEDYMQNGKINPVAGIFLMKNNMHYTDVQEHIVTPNAERAETPELLVENSKFLPE